MTNITGGAVRASQVTAEERHHRGFFIHLIVFVAVMAGLIAIDYTDGGTWWVQWPLIGWGIGILGHAYRVFFAKRNAGGGIGDRKANETLGKM